ncbi:GAF domain-containing sensor histidine kinase [Halalkalibacter alkalisediminis]|uniref:histidine kinase n=1 Tax=Halalkalibacter alkalisediminis TaxID=935616 RepID=A0ABV6NMS9_9BACI|nr:GAF domain-containing sensor histidine kinase [Halalkalibacter alkalisediminis]
MATDSVLETLRLISKTLNKGMKLEEMLQYVLESVLEVTKLESGWIFLVDQAGHHSLAASFGLPAGLSFDQNKPLCEGGCWCKDKYYKGSLQKAVNIMECQRLERVKKEKWGETREISHHATVPIFAGTESFGLMNVASPNKLHFTEAELDLLEMVAYQIGATVKRVELLEIEQKRARLLEYVGTFISFLQKQENNLEMTATKIVDLFAWERFTLSVNDSEIAMGDTKGKENWSTETVFGETHVQVKMYDENSDEQDQDLAEQLIHHICIQAEKERLADQKKEMARVDERNRLARDLHDSVNQMLFSISLTAKGAQRQTSEAKTSEALAFIQDLSQEALKGLKQLIYQLRSVDLEEGMLHALKHYGHLLEVDVQVKITGLLTLSKSSEECLWRVAQEALNNVKKHSGVQEAMISIEATKEHVKMEIKDLGCGATLNEQIHPRSTGISGMKARVEGQKGTFDWKSNRNKGTSVKVIIPNN